LLMEAKALAGFDTDKRAAIERVATRHMEVEKYQYVWLEQLLLAGQPHPMLAAYADTRQDQAYPDYSPDYLREVVSAESSAQAADFDAAIGQWLSTPEATMSFSTGNELQGQRHDHAQLNAQFYELLRHFGAHSRIFVSAGIAVSAPASSAAVGQSASRN